MLRWSTIANLLQLWKADAIINLSRIVKHIYVYTNTGTTKRQKHENLKNMQQKNAAYPVCR